MINYYLLTKPGIILGNLVTMVAGFWLASQGSMSVLIMTTLGLTCIIGSACAFNNYLDREIDKKMERTKTRVLVQGSIPVASALAFAFALALIGNLILFQVNVLTLLLANLGLLIYVFPYSMWKKETIYGTAIGSVAGALPPVIGYTAAGGGLDFNAFLLFILLVLWQMPHFYALAIYHFEDYKRAGVPILPHLKGIPRTQLHIHLYILALTFALFLLPVNRYLVVGLVVLSSLWLALSVQGFFAENKEEWGRRMFQFSLLMINVLCFGIIIST